MSCIYSDPHLLVPLITTVNSIVVIILLSVWIHRLRAKLDYCRKALDESDTVTTWDEEPMVKCQDLFGETEKLKRMRSLPLPPSDHKRAQADLGHQYETIVETVARTLTELNRDTVLGQGDADEDVCERFTREIVRRIKGRDSTFPLRRHPPCPADKSFPYFKEVKCRASGHQYEEVRAPAVFLALDDEYASFGSTPNLSKKRRNKNWRKSYGSKDHLKFLREFEHKGGVEATSYLEPKSFVPREHCPTTLRNLCQDVKPSIEKDKEHLYHKFVNMTKRNIGQSSAKTYDQERPCVTPSTSTSSADSGCADTDIASPTKKIGPPVPPKHSRRQNISCSSDSVFL